jgi:hypothetical protein
VLQKGPVDEFERQRVSEVGALHCEHNGHGP